MFKNWELFAAALALVVGVWNQIKSILSWVRGLFVITARLDSETAGILARYLILNGRSSTAEKVYSSAVKFVRPLGKTSRIPMRWINESNTLFFHRRRPIFIKKMKNGDDFGFTIMYFRGSIVLEDLLVAAIKDVNDFRTGNVSRYKVVYHHGKTLSALKNRDDDAPVNTGATAHWAGCQPVGWHEEDIGPDRSHGRATLSLSAELKDVLEELRIWRESRDWYRERNIMWRRGMLFHGSPGTGKTSLARAIAIDFDVPVHVFDLATMSNEDLRMAWNKMSSTTPCIALLEDIDAVFDGRKNVAEVGGLASSGGLTFDCLLNCIDGVEQVDGVVMIVTTNDKSRIDPALIDRPGRVDRIVEFKPLDLAGRVELAHKMFDDLRAAEDIAAAHGDMPAAKFQEICCQRALAAKFSRRGVQQQSEPRLVRQVPKNGHERR